MDTDSLGVTLDGVEAGARTTTGTGNTQWFHKKKDLADWKYFVGKAAHDKQGFTRSKPLSTFVGKRAHG